MSDYVPYTYSLGFKITNEAIGEEFEGVRNAMDNAMASMLRMTNVRMDVSMGAGLSHEDAKYLLDALDNTLKQAQLTQKPAPTMLNTMRAWLAAKIRPTNEDDYE